MFFLPLICFGLALFVAWLAHHEQSQALYMVAFALVVAALCTSFMSYLVYSLV